MNNSSFLDGIHFQHSYQTLGDALFKPVPPTPLEQPTLLLLNHSVAREFFAQETLSKQDIHQLTCVGGGQLLTPSMRPIAQKYCGHQFGVFNPSLGDGRGLLLGEFASTDGRYFDLHLKGAGPTPFSRGGDGRAVLRSSIREYLISEYLHQLGIPSTRSLAVISSSTPVQRETTEMAASLLRIARTHIRFGHFEYLFHSSQHDLLQQLMDHVIDHYYPSLRSSNQPYAALFDAITARTAVMLAHWQAQGFCHGVMNTDNFSIVGETFDFGPFSMLDSYQPNFICNHTDWQGRYAYNRQPQIGLWNLNTLAACFSPWVGKTELTQTLQRYGDIFHEALFEIFSHKLGISAQHPQAETLITQLLDTMAQQSLDFPLTFIQLTDHCHARLAHTASETSALPETLHAWQQQWQQAQLDFGHANALQVMQQSNPRYPLRNSLLQEAISHTLAGDNRLLLQLNSMVQAPFTEDPELAFLRQPPAKGCGNLALSCSS